MKKSTPHTPAPLSTERGAVRTLGGLKMPSEINFTQEAVASWVTIAAQFAAILLVIGLLVALIANKKSWFLPTATLLFAVSFVIFGSTVAAGIDNDTLVIVLIPSVILSCWGRDRFKGRS